MTPADALHEAVETLASQPVETDLTFSEVLSEYVERYGARNATRRIAEDAGIIPSGMARLPVKGSPERRTYDSFKRRIERYTTPAGEKRTASPQWVLDLARRVGSARVPGTLARTLHEMRLNGVGIEPGAQVWMTVSNERVARRRTQPFSLYIDPGGPAGDDFARFLDAASSGDWQSAAESFAQAWATEYGVGSHVTWDEVESLTLTW